MLAQPDHIAAARSQMLCKLRAFEEAARDLINAQGQCEHLDDGAAVAAFETKYPFDYDIHIQMNRITDWRVAAEHRLDHEQYEGKS